MAEIDLTPAKLAELKQKAEAAKDVKWPTLDQFPQHEEYPAAELIVAADPATVLALIARIRQLEEQVAVLSKIERDRWLQAAKALGIKPRNLGHGN